MASTVLLFPVPGGPLNNTFSLFGSPSAAIASGTQLLTVQNLSFDNSWIRVNAGSTNTIGVTSANTLYMWGLGTSGQIGDNTVVSKSSPVQVGTSSWTQVSDGTLFAMAIQSDGTLWGWGGGTNGAIGEAFRVINRSNPNQVGNNWPQLTTILSPMQVGSGTSWKQVSAGNSYTMAISSNDKLYVWGNNTVGRLGDNTTIAKSSPTQLGTGSWSQISAGNSTTAAITK